MKVSQHVLCLYVGEYQRMFCRIAENVAARVFVKDNSSVARVVFIDESVVVARFFFA